MCARIDLATGGCCSADRCDYIREHCSDVDRNDVNFNFPEDGRPYPLAAVREVHEPPAHANPSAQNSTPAAGGAVGVSRRRRRNALWRRRSLSFTMTFRTATRRASRHETRAVPPTRAGFNNTFTDDKSSLLYYTGAYLTALRTFAIYRRARNHIKNA